MIAASSRAALLVRSCRRCRGRLMFPRLIPSEQSDTVVHPTLRGGGGNMTFNNTLTPISSPPHSRRTFFSTISFDGNNSPFDFYASFIPTTSHYSDSESSNSNKPIATRRRLSKNSSPDQFQQQIERWISSNPKIAPYKAEESLARLWVEQREIFSEWEKRREERAPTAGAGATASSLAYASTPPTVLLTTESVNLVLRAWSHSDNGEIAAERAERLLRWMEDLHADADSARSSFLPKPNYQSYATVIDAWSRAAVYESVRPDPVGSDVGADADEDAETKSGGKAVSRATRAGFECAKRAEELLMHMQRMHELRLRTGEEDGINDEPRSPSSVGYYASEIQPDTRVFNLVLKAWGEIRGGTKASAIRAMRILDLMQELHHVQSMSAQEWRGIALSKVQPNLKTYKHVIRAWAQAAHTIEGPDRAEEILRHLLSLSKAGNVGSEVVPDAECFHIAMKAHAEAIRRRRKGDDGSASGERAHKVTALLDWMELLALRPGTTSKIRPTAESYRIALSAWVWSHHVNAPTEAGSVLRRMIRAAGDANDGKARTVAVAGRGGSDPSAGAVRPETRDFNTVINCCSFARKVGKDRSEEDDSDLLARQLAHQEVYDVAEWALEALLDSPHARPDSATFSGIIRAAVNLLPNTDARDVRVIELFRLAYRTSPGDVVSSAKISTTSTERMRAPPGGGCVDANVLRQLRHALPSTEDYIRVREEFEKHRAQNCGKE